MGAIVGISVGGRVGVIGTIGGVCTGGTILRGRPMKATAMIASVLMIAPFINGVTTSAFDKEDTNSVRVFSNVS
ncbi:MAG: hypothetical protein ACNYVW_01795 [Methanosarcinales archaeon]